MVTKGLLARLQSQSGKNSEVEQFLKSALPLAQAEPATTAWYAIHFGGSEYGIFDVFPDDAGRKAHLTGPIAKALMAQAASLLSEEPKIQELDVLAHKLPKAPLITSDTKALLLTLEAKSGHQEQVQQFLHEAQPWVEEEPDTTAWFAIRLNDGKLGIFDSFPDQGGRLKHLAGRVARELARHSLSFLGGLPDPEFLDVLAEKL
jgi:quinol monooxygenase YgiN